MRLVGLAALIFAAGAGSAMAQEPAPAAAPAAAAAAADKAVTSYPAAFFADQAPNTAADMIDRLPGFSFDGGGGVRGFAGAAGNVLIDGQRPTSKNDDLYSVIRRIPASQVERIDVIRGGAPGIDMQGKTVVANIIRKAGGGTSGVVAFAQIFTGDGRYNPQGRVEITHHQGDKTFEGSVLFARFYDDGAGPGPRRVLNASNVVTDLAHSQNQAGGLQNTVTGAFEQPVLGGKFRINAFAQDMRWHQNFDDDFVFSSPHHELENDRQHRLDGEVGAHYDHPLWEKTSLELIGLQHSGTNVFVSRFAMPGESDNFQESDRSSESIARAVVHWNHSDKLTFEGGGEFAFNVLTSKTSFISNGSVVQLPAANVRVEEKRGEVFGQATWRPVPTFTVEAGARVETSTISSSGDVVLQKTLTYPKPRVVMTWSPNPENQVRVRFEREVGQLNFRDFVATSSLNGSGVQVGNPDIVPQKAWVAEATYERHFWKSGAAVIGVTHNQLEDVVDRKPVHDPGCSDVPGNPLYRPTCPVGGQGPSVFDSPGNIGTGTEDDLFASLTLPLDRFLIPGGMLKGQANWRFMKVTDPTTGVEREISGRRPLDAEAHFSQDLPRLKFSWGVNVNVSWRERYFRLTEVDTYDLGTFVQLFGEYKPKRDLGFRVEIENAGARPFVITRQVFSGPRNTSPVAFTDRRNQNNRPAVYFRVRKTFG